MDTICAISTPYGAGAISIIRVSGSESIDIVQSIFSDKSFHKALSHTIHYGHIIDDNVVIDEVLVSLFRAPKTFTKEDVCEINLHGGVYSTNKVLEILIKKGCRLAEPGEFTKRAFLNGRIDLTQAEAVMDIISSDNIEALKMANNNLSGRLSNEIKALRSDILNVIAQIEVNIDYPEYDDAIVMTNEILLPSSKAILDKMDKILLNSRTGKLIKDGIKTAIIGKPNVGKSSLLNYLLEEDKAIVTSVAGTTRDTVEAYFSIRGITLKLIDTAGIHETTDIVEKIGIDKTKKAIDEAYLVILVLDSSSSLSDEDKQLLELTKDKKRIIVLNKIDLADTINLDSNEVVKISTIKEIGMEALENKIVGILGLDAINDLSSNYMSNARQIGKLENAKTALLSAVKAMNDYLPVDMAEIDLKEAFSLLGEIIGETYSDELIDELFSKFCLGK